MQYPNKEQTRFALLIMITCLLVTAAAVFRPNSVSAESTRAAGDVYNPIADWVDIVDSDLQHNAIAWGDVDGDGDLDAAYGRVTTAPRSAVTVVLNDNGLLNGNLRWESDEAGDVRDVAWGDVDGDGDLDLAVAVYGAQNRLYINTNGTLATTATLFSTDADNSTSLAWGALNNDATLDLVVGNFGQPNKYYANVNGVLQSAAAWNSADSQNTNSIALSDVTGDGHVDLAVGNGSQPNQLFFNTGTTLNMGAGWSSVNSKNSTGVVLTDIDQDGGHDLVVANHNAANHIYFNTGGTLETAPSWASSELDLNASVAAGDMNADGYPDLVFSASSLNAGGNPAQRIYLNILGAVNTTSDWNDNVLTGSFMLDTALADVNGDGLLDLSFAAQINSNFGNELYFNETLFHFPTATDWQSNPPSAFDWTNALAWGDVNGDGFLDLVSGNWGFNQVNLFANGILTTTSTPIDSDTSFGDFTRALAFGDMNGDGIADLATANSNGITFVNGESNKVYLGTGSAIAPAPAWQSAHTDVTTDAAWADFDSDGDLDLVTVNADATDKIHINDGTTLATTAGWESDTNEDTQSVAWVDINNDGDLDLITGIHTDTAAIKLYENAGGTLATASSWSPTDAYFVSSLATGDLNGDGLLDIVAVSQKYQPVRIYFNNGGGYNGVADWVSTNAPAAYEVVLGDLDSDGDLDIAIAGETIGAIYLNDAGTVSVLPDWEAADVGTTNMRSAAVGDADSDGDLDFVIGARRAGIFPNRLYFNAIRDADSDFAAIIERPSTSRADFYSAAVINDTPIIPVTFKTFDAARLPIGRIEMQFSLDGGGIWQTATAAVGSDLQQLQTEARPTVNGNNTHTFNWDVAADGVFGLNDNVLLRLKAFSQTVSGTALNFNFAQAVAGPYQAGATYSQSFPFRVRGTQVRVLRDLPVAHWQFEEGSGVQVADSSENDNAGSIAGAASFSSDVPPVNYDNSFSLNFDGSNDFITVPDSASLDVTQLTVGAWVKRTGVQPSWQPLINRENNSGGSRSFGLYLTAGQPDQVYASINNGCGVPGVVVTSNARLALNTWAHVMLTYDGAEAKLYINGQLDNSAPFSSPICQTNEALTIGGGNIAAFDRFVGRLDDVRLYDAALSAGEVAALADGSALGLEGAIVYRLPDGAASDAQPIGSGDTPFTTDNNGYLQGRGQVNIGDTLYGLFPLATADSHTVYQSSGVPTAAGVTGHTVTQAGVQTLTASGDYPLILFNLDLSLEWDARNDGAFLDDLDRAISNASGVLFDASNGQMAIGDVRVHQRKENWLQSDVIVFASRGIRPMANIGGVVNGSTNDIGVTGVITDAFAPGQVRMGANWDPFGSNAADLAQDWQRAFAHELAHYLLYLPDNYIGIVNGSLAYIDCFGSLMTNTYDDDYSEFLLQPQWTGDCLTSVAELETGRTDWETITTFYPSLKGTPGTSSLNSGPAILPLDLTTLIFDDPAAGATALPIRTFDLRAAEGANPLLAVPRAEGYLHKTNGTPADLTDDNILQLGAAGGGGDRLVVRGADVGDRVCAYDAASARLGCSDVDEATVTVALHSLPMWKPEIQVTPVSSVTFNITVTLLSAESSLTTQLIPGYGSDAAPDVIIPAVANLTSGDGGFTYVGQVTLAYPAFEGIVRVVIPSSNPVQEAVTAYNINSAFWGGNNRAWGGNNRAWGGNNRAWGGNNRAWGAPLTSGDGQASIFNADDPFGANGISSLQGVPRLPALPAWLTAVGNGYRVLEEASYASTPFSNDIRVISFNYLQSQVPDGYEYALHVYNSADNGQTWQRIDTIVDQNQNLATARVTQPATGLYALMATVDVPAFEAGWNLFGFPIPESRAITTSLLSISGTYETVYYYDAFDTLDPWKHYSVALAENGMGFANELLELELGNGYWISMTQAVTLSLGVPTQAGRDVASGIALPPSTFYGTLTSDGAFQPSVGSAVSAFVDGLLCGQGEVIEWLGGLGFVVDVSAENPIGAANGCGTADAAISFTVDGTQMIQTGSWNNSRLQEISLTPGTPTAVTLSGIGTVVTAQLTFLLLSLIGLLDVTRRVAAALPKRTD